MKQGISGKSRNLAYTFSSHNKTLHEYIIHLRENKCQKHLLNMA